MKFKLVPRPPGDLATASRILRAVPARAGAVEDCCARLVAETPVAERDDAAAWLVFLRALDVVEATAEGYRRRADRVDPAGCRGRFRGRVVGADAVVDVLEGADEPLSTTAVIARVLERESTSAGGARVDRNGTDGSGSRVDRDEADRRERIERLLGWAVLLGAAERTADGFRATEDGASSRGS